MANYENMTTADLGDLYSDYHKDVFGVRPRDVAAGDRAGLIAGLVSLDSYLDARRSTAEGRNALRNEGWVITEPSAEADGYVSYEDQRAAEEAEEVAEAERQAALNAPLPYDEYDLI